MKSPAFSISPIFVLAALAMVPVAGCDSIWVPTIDFNETDPPVPPHYSAVSDLGLDRQLYFVDMNDVVQLPTRKAPDTDTHGQVLLATGTIVDLPESGTAATPDGGLLVQLPRGSEAYRKATAHGIVRQTYQFFQDHPTLVSAGWQTAEMQPFFIVPPLEVRARWKQGPSKEGHEDR